MDNEDAGDDAALSVVDRVLTAFTKSLAEEDGYSDIAARLRETLLDKRDFSETALELALFEVEQS